MYNYTEWISALKSQYYCIVLVYLHMCYIATEHMTNSYANNLCNMRETGCVLMEFHQVKTDLQLGVEGLWSLDRSCYWVCLFLS